MSLNEKESLDLVEKLLGENSTNYILDDNGNEVDFNATLPVTKNITKRRKDLKREISDEIGSSIASLCSQTSVHTATPHIPKNRHNISFSWLNLLQVDHRGTISEYKDDPTFDDLPTPPAPDGGWGWLVVLGAFFVNMIADGISFSFGLLYSELLVQFGATRGMTSLLGSIFLGTSLMLGPLASSLTTRFGCRTVIISGGICASSGLFLSSFATSMEMLCFTFSIVVGAGFSMLFVANIVIVALYFKRRRSLATGIAFCGTGFGTFIFAPLLEFLISEYGWRGMFLILSGVSLNLVVCGMLFRPLEFTDTERRQLMLERFKRMTTIRYKVESQRISSKIFDSLSSEYVFEDECKALSTLNIPTYISQSDYIVSNTSLNETIKTSPDNIFQRLMINTLKKEEKEFCYSISTKHGLQNDSDDQKIHNEYKADFNLKENEHSYLTINCSFDDLSKSRSYVHLQESSLHTADRKCNVEQCGFEVKEDVHKENLLLTDRNIPDLYSGRRRGLIGINFPLVRTDIFYRYYDKKGIPKRQRTLSTSCPQFMEAETTHLEHSSICDKINAMGKEIAGFLKRMKKIMTNSFFLVFIASNFLFYFWNDIPYMYAADHAMENDIDSKKASFLISITGISNTLGQVVFGYIGDLNCNILNVYAVVSVLAGVCIIPIPLMINYWSACIVYSCFGFFVSVSYPLTIVLLVKYLGLKNLTNGQGLLLMVQGIANLFGPPIAGLLSDMTGNYNTAFYLSGLFHIISGLILLCVYIPALNVNEENEDTSEGISIDMDLL